MTRFSGFVVGKGDIDVQAVAFETAFMANEFPESPEMHAVAYCPEAPRPDSSQDEVDCLASEGCSISRMFGHPGLMLAIRF